MVVVTEGVVSGSNVFKEGVAFANKTRGLCHSLLLPRSEPKKEQIIILVQHLMGIKPVGSLGGTTPPPQKKTFGAAKRSAF